MLWEFSYSRFQVPFVFQKFLKVWSKWQDYWFIAHLYRLNLCYVLSNSFYRFCVILILKRLSAFRAFELCLGCPFKFHSGAEAWAYVKHPLIFLFLFKPFPEFLQFVSFHCKRKLRHPTLI